MLKIKKNLYWNKFYKSKKKLQKPSKFAKFCLKYLKKFNGDLIDVGCGDGRDLLFFNKKRVNVIGIDNSHKALKFIKKEEPNLKNKLLLKNFSKVKFDRVSKNSVIYSRFTLHTITKKEELEFLKNLYLSKKVKLIFIETRTIKDDFYGKGKKVGKNEYIFSHYRRFIDPEELTNQLKKNKFKVIYFSLKKNYAKFKKENPCVLRLIAKKK